MRSIAIPVVVLLCTASLYIPRLRDAPASVRDDEVISALYARSVASSGRDLYSRFLPLLFYPREPAINGSLPPIMVYAIAIALKVAPFNETTIRLPTVMFGILDVMLVYAIGRLLFGRTLLALVAAAFVALSPAHFIHARYALPAQVPTSFILGWVLCVLAYDRRPDPRLLFVAGALLFTAALSYFAVIVLLPAYVLLTGCALLVMRAPRSSYAYLIAGVAIPGLFCVPWVVLHAAAIRPIIFHYQWSAGPGSGVFSELARMGSLYWHFWDPSFLFISGSPRFEFSTGLIGTLLLPMAGLLAVGVLAAARRLSPGAILLLGGFLTAQVPASLVGEGHAIWRALEVVPFAALLAAFGLALLFDAGTARARRAGTVAVFSAVVCLAASHHGMPFAQAIVRAAIVPIFIVGLSWLLSRFDVADRDVVRNAIAWLVIFVLIQVGLQLSNAWTIVVISSALVCVISVVMLLPDSLVNRATSRPALAGGVLALVSSAFMYFHVERSIVPVHARAVLLTMRIVPGAVALAVALVLASARTRLLARRSPLQQTAIALVGMVALQVAYFYVDYFHSNGARFVHAVVVLLACVVLAMLMQQTALERRTFGPLLAAGVFSIGLIQFGYFYADYFGRYQGLGASGRPPSLGGAWEEAISRAKQNRVPLVYLPPASGNDDLYWTFYLIKHDSEDLRTRTVRAEPGQEFNREHIRRLPAGSIMMSPAGYSQVDSAIDQLIANDLVNDITPVSDRQRAFWVLARTTK